MSAASKKFRKIPEILFLNTSRRWVIFLTKREDSQECCLGYPTAQGCNFLLQKETKEDIYSVFCVQDALGNRGICIIIALVVGEKNQTSFFANGPKEKMRFLSQWKKYLCISPLKNFFLFVANVSK